MEDQRRNGGEAFETVTSIGREEVEACVSKAVAMLERAELEQKLTGVPCAPVNTVLEALSDPQSIARQAVTQHKGVDVLASPLRFMKPSK